MDQNQILSDIRERMVRVETKIDTMTEVQDTAEKAKEVANNAYNSTRSAHKRIDKIDKSIFWISTTIIGAVIVAVLSVIIQGGN